MTETPDSSRMARFRRWRPNRGNLRLQTYDYTSPGPYFVTFCTYRR